MTTRAMISALIHAPLLLALLSVSRLAAAEPVWNYYDIYGHTEQALVKELRSKGPVTSKGKRFDALTRWYVRWKFNYAPRNGSCRITHIETQIETTITMPRWRDQSQASPALVRQWNRYIKALGEHEYTHYSHAVDAAAEIERSGYAFTQNGNCNGMDKAFNRWADGVIEKAKQRDEGYDRRTGHGRTEGAHFP